MSNLLKLLRTRALFRDRRGNVSLLFAMLAIPIMCVIGLAVDYGRQVRMHNAMQQAIDTAVLAGANGVSPTVASGQQNQELTSLIERRVATALAGTGARPAVTVSVDPSAGAITARAETTVQTLFMGLMGKDQTKVSVTATAIAGAGVPMEVAIAFDTTHSMAGTKLAAAQEAASELTDLLFHMPGSSAPNPNMKVALVPFTSYVNVGIANRSAPWLNVPADYSVADEYCEDTWVQLAVPVHHEWSDTCYADGQPYACSGAYDDWNDYSKPRVSHICTPTSKNYVWHGCVASQQDPDDAGVKADASAPVPAWMVEDWRTGECPSEMIQLNNDPNTIKTAISGLVEGGETYIAPGLLWGWRALSDDATGPFHAGGPISTTKKRLILMTDGSNTHSPNYGTTSSSSSGSEARSSGSSGSGSSGSGSSGSGSSGSGSGDSGSGSSGGSGSSSGSSGSSASATPDFLGDHENNNVSDADAKTLAICNNIKAAGIEIYAIAFEVTDPSAQTLLSQCASGPPFYYNAMTVADLQEAFQKIGHELMAMRLTE
jgi:Flp pilus assembly protein TadG